MSVNIELIHDDGRQQKMTFETMPRIGEKVAGNRDGQWEYYDVVDVVHYASGREFQATIRLARSQG